MSRIQLALNVPDLEAATDFYRRLLGTEPAKVRPGYVNFAVTEPPLKLVLLEGGDPARINHLGIELNDAAEVAAERERLAAAGAALRDEPDVTCCYARQDKFWVEGAPEGQRWEVYTVLADSPTFAGTEAYTFAGTESESCCGTSTSACC